jgi:hypothetical protein
MSKNTEITTIVCIEEWSDVNINAFICLYSLRSDVLTDSLVDMIKKQQGKTNELEQIYREQQSD